MKYSIIVPIYNSFDTIDRCLESIVNQNFNDYEILLIDDGSTDDSKSKCLEWCDKYSNIIYFHKDNGGVSSARNLGLDNAKGKYILFIDSDDYVEDNYFLELEKTSADTGIVLFTNSQILKTGIKKRNIEEKRTSTRFEKIEYLIDSRTINGPYPKIFCKELIDALDLRFIEDIPVAEDFCFCLRYLLHCQKIEIHNTSIYMNDQSNENSLTRGKKEGLIYVYPLVFKDAFNSIIEADLSSDEKNQLYCIVDRLHVESFGTCVMEELKDTSASEKEIIDRIKTMCEIFYDEFNDTYGYSGIVHYIMRTCIKHKNAFALYYLGKLYVKKRG